MAASQNASNSADSAALNAADTTQYGNQQQNAQSNSGNSGCWSFCGGGGGNVTGQSQWLDQNSNTSQFALSAGIAKQNAVNANVPVTIVGKGHVDAKSGGANQNLDNSANSAALNASETKQKGNQDQNAESSSGNSGCSKFCGGGGGNVTAQDQWQNQNANTEQAAASIALAKQNAVNANVPVTIVGSSDNKDHGKQDGNWDSGSNWGGSKSGGAEQNANNSASSFAANFASTTQHGNQNQNADSDSGSWGGGKFGAGGGGNVTPQLQKLSQNANTEQAAISAAVAAQWLTNANAGVDIG